MWKLDCEESWASKNWCFWTVVLEKTLESPLDCKEIQLVHSEGDQPWVFFGRTDAKAETPILWPPHAKSWLTGKDSDAGRDWGQGKGMTEDEVAGWHHRLDGHEFGRTLGVGDGQGGLVCCNSWGCKESDTTERLNWTECLGSSHPIPEPQPHMQGSPHHEEQRVLCAHCLRRDSGQATPAERPTRDFHTFPQLTLPSWWGLMHTAAGSTSTDPTIHFRSHSRPWSSPTESRVPFPPPGPDLSLRSGG